MVVTQAGRFFLMPTLASQGNTLFVIGAPWCGHCHRLSQTLRTATQRYGLNVMYMIGDESAESSRVMRAMNATGFPTIFNVLPGGQLVRYEGPRTAEALAGM